MVRVLVVIGILVSVSACSDDKTDKVEQHVWQEQTDMIDKAKDVEGMVLDFADEQRQSIDQSSQ